MKHAPNPKNEQNEKNPYLFQLVVADCVLIGGGFNGRKRMANLRLRAHARQITEPTGRSSRAGRGGLGQQAFACFS